MKQFTTVVKLVQNYRQKCDPWFAAYLDRVRNGTQTNSDVKRIRTRVLGKADPSLNYNNPLWRRADHIFSRNDAISIFNIHSSLSAAAELGLQPIIIWARDDTKDGVRSLSRQARLELPHYRPQKQAIPPGTHTSATLSPTTLLASSVHILLRRCISSVPWSDAAHPKIQETTA